MASFLLAGLVAGLAATQQAPHDPPHLDCGFRPREAWLADLRAAVARGEIADPALRVIPPIRPRPPRGASASTVGTTCLTREQVFQYEDTNGLLVSGFSTGELLDFMTEAANAMLAAHGDLYDFVGFWTNFAPDHKIGAAFYASIENDVDGLGLSLFNDRAMIGLGGDNVEGYVMMWNVNNGYWEAGAGPGADFTRLALAQEFEHRFAMFLPDLLDGRPLQGDNGSCGRMAHWNWKVDGQGSGMEISEWVGSAPAILTGSFVSFNTDIPGGVFSYTDLYLMGYVSPAEMDAGNSELRYMDNVTDCSTGSYNGPISAFSSADIIAAAGPRVPDHTAEDQSYRTGWIMLYEPGSPPTDAELDKAVGILQQRQIDWEYGTLGLGTMDDSLFDDCNCNGVPDETDILSMASLDLNGNAVPDECEALGTPLCFGDSTGTACPCGNTGAMDRGCAHSGGVGMSIRGIGSASVTADDMGMVAEDCPVGNTGIFYAGKTSLDPGNVLYDGLQCAGGDVRRFQGLFQADGVAVDEGFVAQDPSGVYFNAGDTVYFQYWSRDVAVPSPCGTGANFSPSDRVVMTP